MKTIFIFKIIKILSEPFTVVCHSGGSRKPGTCPDHDGICCLDLVPEPFDPFFSVACTPGDPVFKSSDTADPSLDRFQVAVWHFSIIPVHNTFYPHL